MSEHDSPPTPDELEQATPVAADDDVPTPTDVLAERGVPLDADEADVLEQAHLEPVDEDDA